jgi:hypothetical protein
MGAEPPADVLLSDRWILMRSEEYKAIGEDLATPRV